MLRTLAFLIVLALVAAASAAVGNIPGEIAIDAPGYKFRLPVGVAIGIGLILSIVLVFATLMINRVFRLPYWLSQNIAEDSKQKGLRAIALGLVAISNDDKKLAARYAKQASKFLADKELARIFLAQAASISGDSELARKHFLQLTDHPDTAFMAQKALCKIAFKENDLSLAKNYAAKASAARPSSKWAYSALISLQMKSGDWEDAQISLDSAERFGLVPRDKAKRMRAAIFTAHAYSAENKGAFEDSKEYALKAAKMAHDFPPATLIAARRLTGTNHASRAAKLMQSSWKSSPHPAISTAYANLEPGEPTEDLANRMLKLAALNPDHQESRLLAAAMLADKNDWSEARSILSTEIKDRRSVRALNLMAALVKRERGDSERSLKWLRRATKVPREPYILIREDFNLSTDEWCILIKHFGETGLINAPELSNSEFDLDPRDIEWALLLENDPEPSSGELSGDAASAVKKAETTKDIAQDTKAFPPPPDMIGPAPDPSKAKAKSTPILEDTDLRPRAERPTYSPRDEGEK